MGVILLHPFWLKSRRQLDLSHPVTDSDRGGLTDPLGITNGLDSKETPVAVTRGSALLAETLGSIGRP
jgi:hypothetical protein